MLVWQQLVGVSLALSLVQLMAELVAWQLMAELVTKERQQVLLDPRRHGERRHWAQRQIRNARRVRHRRLRYWRHSFMVK
jgi:hypothetical protein